MMRLTRAQFAPFLLLTIGLIAADLFAFWVWATRPPRIYSDWLGLHGFRSDAPFARVVSWAGWSAGPRTPSGFLALFDLGELAVSSVLLLAPFLLVLFLLSPLAADAQVWRRLSAKVGPLRFRTRTALVLVAIIAVYMCWEIHEWRAWQMRADYWRGAAQNSQAVAGNLSTLRSIREERPYIPGSEWGDASARRVLNRSKAAAASGIAVTELKKQDVDVALAKLIVSTARKLEAERAAANPLNPVARDRTMPQTPEEAADWLRLRDYRRALAVYDELARTYPDLVEAHSRSAWLRATCPDAQYRDGKLAVESARRACELTNWHNPGELEVLAAACAEAGDFESAVKWQEKVLTLTVEPAGVQSCQERLALYRAGKPFRQP
jgi:tetratricopeptide (TPR) repeat protein